MKYAKGRHTNERPVKKEPEPPVQKRGFRPMPKNLRAWATTQSIRMDLYIGRKGEYESEAEAYGAENVGLSIKVGRGSVWLALASMTEQELLVIKDLFVTACDAALPVCQYLDRVAQAAVERGDEEIQPRVFKLAPVLIKKDTTAFAPTDNGEEYESNRALGGAAPSGDEPPQAGLQQEHDQSIQF